MKEKTELTCCIVMYFDPGVCRVVWRRRHERPAIMSEELEGGVIPHLGNNDVLNKNFHQHYSCILNINNSKFSLHFIRYHTHTSSTHRKYILAQLNFAIPNE